MKVPKTSVFEYLNYQMFTKKKYGTSQEVIVSILSERHGSNAKQQRLN
jgi:hypothetical protein